MWMLIKGECLWAVICNSDRLIDPTDTNTRTRAASHYEGYIMKKKKNEKGNKFGLLFSYLQVISLHIVYFAES